MKSLQRGGFALGLIVGLLVGLALALGVALYVTKAPNPFIDKVPARPAGLDAAEAERNRNWDPNAGLAGKNPARPNAASGVVAPAPSAVAAVPATPDNAARDANAAAVPPAPPVAPAPPPVLATGDDPFTYFVQAGAYSHSEDAEQQRARLAMLGLQARLSEREQAGRTVYRVRTGPYARREEADAARQKLTEAGVEAALVRVQK